MAADISTASGSVVASIPRALFSARLTTSLFQERNHYIPDATGQRFPVTAMSMPAEGRVVAPIVIVQNWLAALPK